MAAHRSSKLMQALAPHCGSRGCSRRPVARLQDKRRPWQTAAASIWLCRTPSASSSLPRWVSTVPSTPSSPEASEDSVSVCRQKIEEFQETLKEPDDIWIRGSQARLKFNLTRDDLRELGENYIIKANPYEAEQAPFKQYALKEVVALAIKKHGEQALLEYFSHKCWKQVGQVGGDFGQLYGHVQPEEESDMAPRLGKAVSVHGQKRYWYNAPSTTTTEGWQSVMQGLKTNAGICTVKGAVWYSTGSHAMFADWMHSIADVANYSYRLMELNRSGRARDVAHPYGYAPLRYITADRSFVFLGLVGGAYPLGLGLKELWDAWGGVIKLGDNLFAPAIVFLISIALEGAAVNAAYREILSQAPREQIGTSDRNASFFTNLQQVFRYLREGRDVMSTATFTEAGSGVLSSCVGLLGLGLSYHLQNGVPDVAASVLMASMVCALSQFLLRKSGNALLGQTLPRWRVKELVRKLEAHAAVVNVYDVKTELVGMDTVRFKAEVQFNAQVITERILLLHAKTGAEAPVAELGRDVALAHAMLSDRLQEILPQLAHGLPEEPDVSMKDSAAAAWLYQNNGLFYEALAWELKDAERVLRMELQDFKNVHLDLEPW
eukprot:TRINITY_DN62486_c0_g1_i1.p1 TRINITY_DN62486_c0_g1~~TRINITY_DN62486_c0_g1_i1.p1  ORF type:complete len:613 (-),score=126.90 TRINITY_DN62486_c0_g1_i1:29-1846(-)